jgi:hypothetical protein
MTSEAVSSMYNAKPLESIPEGFVVLNINKKYKRGMGQNGIYDCTKACWSINKNRVQSIKYVLSEYRGLIVEAFEVERWYGQDRGYGSKSKRHGETKTGWCFDGKVAPKEIRDEFVGKSLVKTRGSANVVRFNV